MAPKKAPCPDCGTRGRRKRTLTRTVAYKAVAVHGLGNVSGLAVQRLPRWLTVVGHLKGSHVRFHTSIQELSTDYLRRKPVLRN